MASDETPVQQPSFVRLWQNYCAVKAERDAAIERAERAERERDGAAEIARLRALVQSQAEDIERGDADCQAVVEERNALRAQLAAAQADAVALRGALGRVLEAAQEAEHGLSEYVRQTLDDTKEFSGGLRGLVAARYAAAAALATPAPGAPLLDAVRGIVKAAAAVLGSRGAGCGQRVVVGSSEVAALEPALAAVRALLPTGQAIDQADALAQAGEVNRG